MPVDIEDGDAATVDISGGTCTYVLSVIVGKELEMSLFTNDPADLEELRVALDEALQAKEAMILLRAEARAGTIGGWQSLDPGTFVRRLPRA